MHKRLEELTKRRDQITAQIQAVKAREQTAERKRDTRRKVLIGAAVMERVKNGKWPEERLLAMMNEFLTKDMDRQLFNLPSPGAAVTTATPGDNEGTT